MIEGGLAPTIASKFVNHFVIMRKSMKPNKAHNIRIYGMNSKMKSTYYLK